MMALSVKILTRLTNPQPLKVSGSLQVKKLEAKRDTREAVLNPSITLTMLSITPFRNVSIAMLLCFMSSRPGILNVRCLNQESLVVWRLLLTGLR